MKELPELKPRPDVEDGRILTTAQAAEHLNMSTATLRSYTRRGLVPVLRVGKLVVYDRDALQVPQSVVDRERRKARLKGVTRTARPKKDWITYPRKAGLKRTSYFAGFLRTDGTYRRIVLHDEYGHRVTNKGIADKIALAMWEEGVPGAADGFGPFLESFWSETGVYARDKRDQGEPLSVVYQANNYNNVRGHIRPALKHLGKDELPVDRVTPELLRTIMRMVGDKHLKGRTVNTVRQTFAVPLRAYWEGKLHPERNPCTARLVPLFDETPRERSVFTTAEARAFLRLAWEDPRIAAVHRQGAFTGMRLGECIGMQHGDLRTETFKAGRATVTEYWIDVRHNWQEREGVKAPKKKSFGEVPVPAAVAQMLLRLEKANPYGGPFLYWGFSDRRPLPKKAVEASYNEGCRRIGITDAQRKARGLGFHAWRHWYDTHLHVDPHVLQKLMRHRTAEMTAHYRHLTDEQRRGASAAAAGLLEAVSPRRRRKAQS